MIMMLIAQTIFCGRLMAQGVPVPGYWSIQFTSWPPLPYNPFPNAATFTLNSNNIAYDDRDVDYSQLRILPYPSLSFGEPPSPPPPGGDEGQDPSTNPPSVAYCCYGTNVLWIEIYAVTNDLAYLTLHNTKSNKW